MPITTNLNFQSSLDQIQKRRNAIQNEYVISFIKIFDFKLDDNGMIRRSVHSYEKNILESLQNYNLVFSLSDLLPPPYTTSEIISHIFGTREIIIDPLQVNFLINIK